MQDAGEQTSGAMGAVIGLEDDIVAGFAKKFQMNQMKQYCQQISIQKDKLLFLGI